MIRVTLYLLLPLVVAAQPTGRVRSGPLPQNQPQNQPPPVRPEDFCSVEGQVLNAATGEPLGKASLTLRRVDSPQGGPGAVRSLSASSSASGKFSIVNIEPGKYRLSATRTGFVNAEYGARDFLQQGETLALDAGRKMGDLLVRMTPNGVVTGKVVDEDREPVAFLTVQAMRYRYTQGRKQFVSLGSATTNDIGEYRIFGLPPGRYYISVSPRRSYGQEKRNAEEEYVPTYYPGTTDPAAAAPLDIGPGVQFRGADVGLAKRRTVHVTGHVTDASGSERRRPLVYLTARTGSAGANRPAMLDANGNFDIQGVVAGSYILMAALPDRGRSLAARMPVEVGNNNVENLSLTINPALTLSGSVRLDGQATASLSSVQVTLRPRDPVGLVSGSSYPTAKVKDDGSFSVTGVNPDLYSVTFAGLPDGFYVKAVLTGGQDVSATGLDLSRGASGAVDVVLAPNAGQAAGLVQGDQQQPAAGVTVVLIPQERERKDQPQYYKTTTTDSAGSFTFKNLDPGQYKVYAWREVESGAYMDPDFVGPVESRGEALAIREGSQENLQLKLIS